MIIVVIEIYGLRGYLRLLHTGQYYYGSNTGSRVLTVRNHCKIFKQSLSKNV